MIWCVKTLFFILSWCFEMKSVVLSPNTDMKQNFMLIPPVRKTRGGIKEKWIFYHRKAFIQRKLSCLMGKQSIVKIFISGNECGQGWPELGCWWQCRCESIPAQSLLGPTWPSMARNTPSNVSWVKELFQGVSAVWQSQISAIISLSEIHPPKPGGFAASGAQGCGFICFLCNTQSTCCSDLGGNWAAC